MRKPYPISGELKAAGYIFQEDFRDAASTLVNGVSLLNGAYVNSSGLIVSTGQCNLPELHKAVSPISIVMRFTPDFNWDDDGNHYFFDTDASNRVMYAYKTSTNRIQLNVSGSTLVNQAGGGGTWSDAWNTNEVNTIIFSISSGNTDVWLNGTLVAATSASYTSSNHVRKITVGSSNAGGFELTGSIQEFSVLDCVVDDLDEPVLRSGTLISDLAIENSLVTLPLERDYAISGVQSSPIMGQHSTVSPNMQCGDGSSGGTFPTKLTSHRYGYNIVTSEYFTIADHDNLNLFDGSGDLPFTLCISMNVASLAGTRYIFCKGTAITACMIMVYVNTAGTLVFLVGDDDGGYVYGSSNSGEIRVGDQIELVCVYNGSGLVSGFSVYRDNVDIRTGGSSSSYTGMTDTSYPLMIGSTSVPNNSFNGDLYTVQLFKNFAASPMQARVLDYRMKQRLQG